MAGSWIETGRTALKTVGLGSMSLLLSTMLTSAQSIEVKTSISTVEETGAIELALPKGTMVAIGDKVEFAASPTATASTGKPAVEWSVTGLKGDVIIAEPSSKPEVLPQSGRDAVINTFANQPKIAPAAQNAQALSVASEAKIKAATTDASYPPAVAVEPEQAAGDAAPQATPKAAETMTKEQAEAPEAEDPNMPDAEVSEVTAPEVKAPEVTAPEVKATETDSDTQKAAESLAPDNETAEVPVVKEAPVVQEPTAPAPVMECDHLAAHPFDPDAVAKGVYYPDLDAAKVIDACQDAISAYPKEARFYTQLTRGQHKAEKLSLAFAATKRGAELGSGQSMSYLGVMYKNGEVVEEDQTAALTWFEKAAEKGNPGGMVFAAAMYRDGVGTPRNYKRAAELYKMASDQHIAEASADLGIFYDRGQGVERDADKAAELLLSAYLADDKDTQQIFFEAPGVLSEETRKAIQSHLKDKGFYKSSIDADFGSGTRRALLLYKRNAKN